MHSIKLRHCLSTQQINAHTCSLVNHQTFTNRIQFETSHLKCEKSVTFGMIFTKDTPKYTPCFHVCKKNWIKNNEKHNLQMRMQMLKRETQFDMVHMCDNCNAQTNRHKNHWMQRYALKNCFVIFISFYCCCRLSPLTHSVYGLTILQYNTTELHIDVYWKWRDASRCIKISLDGISITHLRYNRSTRDQIWLLRFEQWCGIANHRCCLIVHGISFVCWYFDIAFCVCVHICACPLR